ncbi:MAG: MazG family protein [Chlamydiales bacterium]|jgi:MazG family protein
MTEQDESNTQTPDKRPAELAAAEDPRVLAFRRLLGIVDRLRAPEDGCPWDLKQTEESMAPHLIEEAFELSEAIESESATAIATEAGDVMLNVLLICRIAEDAGRYDLALAANEVSDKLIRRHPHVFGEGQADTAEKVLERWDEIKQAERKDEDQDASALAGLPRGMPALLRAKRICQRAVNAGFAWPSWRGAFDKLGEELGELEAELPVGTDEVPVGEQLERIGEETGDILVAAAFLAHYLELDPERLCRAALKRFEGRFRHMEGALGDSMKKTSLPGLIDAWQAAKRSEKGIGAQPDAS